MRAEYGRAQVRILRRHVTLRTPLAVFALAATFAGAVSRISLTAHAAPPAADAEHARRAVVLASVEGHPITIGDFEDAIANKDPTTRRKLADPAAQARFLSEMIEYDLLIREAERRGYREREPVQRRAKQAAIAAMQSRDPASDPKAIPAADVARYYTENARQYQRAELRRASFIQAASAAEARALIAELRGKDRNTFAKAARERSTDERTKSQGGELGHFERHPDPRAKSQVTPQPLVDAAYALKNVGDISPSPIAIGGQFGIVMLTAHLPAVSMPLALVEGDIREGLASKHASQEADVLAQRLREEAKPETHPELLGLIVLDPPAPPPDIPSGFSGGPPDPRAPAKILPPDPY
jgi:hypothetical protein